LKGEAKMPNIYMTENLHNKALGITPWQYIGSDQNDNDSYYGSSELLVRDMNMLGKDKFVKTILEKFDDITNKELRFREAEYLKVNNVKKDSSFYNLTDIYAPAGGKKGMKHRNKFPRTAAWKESRHGWTPSNETREIWSQQRRGRVTKDSTKEIWKDQRSGGNNSNALSWTLTYATGEIVEVQGLRKYCIDNNLNYGKLYRNTLQDCTAVKHGAGKGGRHKNDTN